MLTHDAPVPVRSLALPELLIGLGLLLCAAVALWQAVTIPVSPMYSKVGPTVFPSAAGAGLAVLAVLLMARALRGGWQPREEREVSIDRGALLLVTAGLLANVVLIGPLGFTAAPTILFVLVCRGFGSRRILRDLLIGLVLALVAFFGFAELLGVNIGAGVVERLLGA